MCMCTCNRDRVCVVNHRQILIGASMHGGCFSFHSQAWSVAKCCNLCQSQARCHSQVHSASAAICTSTISLPQQALITVTGNMVGQGSDLAHVWLQILISYSETGHLTQSVLPWQLQFSLLSSAYFLCPQPSSYLQLCCSLQILKRCKTQWLHFLLFYFNIHWLPIPQRIQYKKDTLCYKCIMRTALSYLCDCLQLYTSSCTIHSAFESIWYSHYLSLQIPNYTRLSTVGSWASSVFSPYTWNDMMAFPFLSDKNAPRTPSNQT